VKKKTITKPAGMWTVEELAQQMPQLLEGYRNPAPPENK
jgi:hypothetical protein